MKLIRNILLKILGFKKYLRLVSCIYLRMVNLGFLKSKYPELFYLKKIIKPGFTCIDIGANVGYYSHFMVKLTGKNGEVYAVEPVPLFGEIWNKNVPKNKSKQLILLPFALGSENKKVTMGTPVVAGMLHHGMTHVVSKNESNIAHSFEAEMRIPDELFNEVSKIDFIKCDVEGYEQYVFSNFIQILSKQKPIIQSELSGSENRAKVIEILENIGYKTFILDNDHNLLEATNDIKSNHGSDFYFFHQS